MRDFAGFRRFSDAWTWWRTLHEKRRPYRRLFGRRMHLVLPGTCSEWIHHPEAVPSARPVEVAR